MRWITLMGRLGTVILMTGLALGLVWLIPSAQTGTTSGGTFPIQPERYTTPWGSGMLTPQTGLYISIESNGSLYFYLLNVFSYDFNTWVTSWVKERFPNLEEGTIEWVSQIYNITVLNAFLESHSHVVLWKSEASNNIHKEFFPTAVSNVTTIIANPSSNLVQLTYEIKTAISLAPKDRILLSTQLLIPIGAVLAIPWIYFTKVRKATLQ